MLRTHTCGELKISDLDKEVVLCGWVNKVRDKGALVWLDLRDRYGITQITLVEGEVANELLTQVKEFGREYVIKVTGKVVARAAQNDKITTGAI